MIDRGLRVTVDADVCIGSGQCELFAPEVFEVRGVSIVKIPRPPEHLQPGVRDAADACPARAISLSPDGG